MDQHPGTDRRFRTRAAAAASTLILLAGCASHKPSLPKAGPGADAGPVGREAEIPGLASLMRAAEEQTRRPATALENVPPPPGVDAALAQRIPTPSEGGDPKAWMTLGEVVKQLAGDAPAAREPQEQGEEAAELALHHYVQGRQKLLEDDKEGAVAELRQATQLDPNAGQPWRELGEALLASGNRTEAIAAFQKSVERGLVEARTLEILGRDAQDRGDNEAAARFYARASLASPEKSDPFLPEVIDIGLAKTLAAQGYTLASRDAMLRAGRRPMQLSASTRYGADFGTIFRRQGEVWREIGDLSCRLGQYGAALEAYERSDDLPTLDAQGITPRVVFAAMRSGQPAAAAISVLRDIVLNASGRADTGSLSLLKYLAGQNRSLGQDIAAALTEYQASLKSPVAPSVAGSLARARAAVASPSSARAILREHLAHSPNDLAAAADLFDALPDAKSAATEAVLIASSRPQAASGVAEALLRSKAEEASLEASLKDASPRPAAQLVLAYLSARRGEAQKAIELVSAVPIAGRFGPAAGLARVEMLLDVGRVDAVREPLAALKSLQGPDGTRAYARALALLQRCKAALAVMEPVLASPAPDGGQRLDDLLGGARLALALGDGERAEQWLSEAMKLDPTDDRAASTMLSLYGPSGPKPDPAKVAQIIRDLRQAGTESRTVRTARVKDLIRRSMLQQAEQEAEELADLDPADTGAIDLLVATWTRRTGDERAAAEQRGREWLQARLARRPLSPGLMAGMTTLLVSGGKAAEAETLLRQRLEQGGGPDLSRMLERVLRGELKKAKEADELTLKRLGGQTHLPSEAIELAEFQIRQGREADAVKALRESIPEDVTLSDDQSARLLAVATDLAQRATSVNPDAAKQAAAAEILDLASRRESKLPPELHEQRLMILSSLPGTSVDTLLEAASLTGKQYPVLADKAHALVSEGLRRSKRSDAALAFMSRAVPAMQSPGLDVFLEWFQVIALAGGTPNVRQFIETAKSAGQLNEFAARLSSGADDQSGPAKDPRAEVAYAFGQFFASNQRTDRATAAYELALEFDPKHPWASNNLGYSLADQGKDLGRAGTLLEQAHASLPNEPSITDSLGWLRYKQGILEDKLDAAGLVQVRGAITLLQAAAMTDHGRRDPTILDHLADALWRAGRRDEAQRYWELTESVAGQELRRSGQSAGPGGPAVQPLSPAMTEEYRKLRDAAGTKRKAARAGGEVAVAPQLPGAEPGPASQQTEKPNTPPPPSSPSGATPTAQGARPGSQP